MNGRKILVGVLLGVAGISLQAKTPETKVTVAHPQSGVVVSHPKTDEKAVSVPPATSTVVNHPTTTGAVSHPTTNVPVLKRATSVLVTHPETSVAVSHPQTTVRVNHPTTTPTSTTESTPVPVITPEVASANKAVNTIPSSSAPTTMSNFQMPKAKDLKAASVTAGEDGFGNPNDAEKSAAAASFELPKGKEVSAESLRSGAAQLQQKMQSALGDKLPNK